MYPVLLLSLSIKDRLLKCKHQTKDIPNKMENPPYSYIVGIRMANMGELISFNLILDVNYLWFLECVSEGMHNEESVQCNQGQARNTAERTTAGLKD